MSLYYHIIGPLAGVLIFGALLALAWFDRLPTIDSVTRMVEMLNTRGGNILILLMMSIIGAVATTRMFYYLTQLSVDGKLQQDNAYALMGLAFLTNQLTGAFIGALLKTMTGDTSTTTNPPAPPVPPSGGALSNFSK